ncbi:MAG: hypothetical protein RJQ04_14350 [Longimicrobiales bacterium]
MMPNARDPRLRATRLTLVAFLAALLMPAPVQADRIPSFARKYGVSCALCHQPAPRLNAFGEDFAGNGFMLARGEVPPDTMMAGDPLLRLQRSLPLAVRMDAYLTGLTESGDGVVATDLQTPWGVKILSGGQVSDDVAYYLYFYMSERGEVVGLEDAYLQFNDVLGTGVDVIAGQFQVSDPLFKRELRLEYEDYNPYRVRVGDVRADLAYERGFMASKGLWGGADLVAGLVNGRGLSHASDEKLYDTDGWKNVFGRISQDVGASLRVGGFVYGGTESVEGVESDFLTWGPDMTAVFGSTLEINGGFLRRVDDNPFFLDGCGAADPRCEDGSPETTVDSWLAEAIWAPSGPLGRWFFTGLYNRVTSDRPVFTVRQGESGPLDRYETLGVTASYLKARNIRLLGEVSRDLRLDRWRFTAGVVTAF